jgi:hypothetical protein
MASVYIVTKTWPKQSLAPQRTEFKFMTRAILFMIDQASLAIQSKRVYDARWLGDDTVQLCSPTGRVLEQLDLTMEDANVQPEKKEA